MYLVESQLTLPDSLRRCQEVSRRFQTVSDGARHSQTVDDGAKKSPRQSLTVRNTPRQSTTVPRGLTD
ncbi:hypothetical protein DPMN_105226, partial [Dreissena polymorpha]